MKLAPKIFSFALLSLIGCIGLHAATEEAINYPENKYGEFPFELTYKVDQIEVTVKDVITCTYELDRPVIGSGWTQRFSSGLDRVVLKELGSGKRVLFLGDPCWLYMNDQSEGLGYSVKGPRLAVEEKTPNHYGSPLITSDEAFSEFGVEIIKYDQQRSAVKTGK